MSWQDMSGDMAVGTGDGALERGGVPGEGAAVREFIAAGETYQVNLSQAFAAPWREAWRGRPLATRAAAVYAALRGATPATMGALLAGARGGAAGLGGVEFAGDAGVGGARGGR
jgi:hypothetical protein